MQELHKWYRSNHPLLSPEKQRRAQVALSILQGLNDDGHFPDAFQQEQESPIFEHPLFIYNREEHSFFNRQDETTITLDHTQAIILNTLILHIDTVVPHENLKAAVWGIEAGPFYSLHTLNVNIYKLRLNMGSAQIAVINLYGIGYKLISSPQDGNCSMR